MLVMGFTDFVKWNRNEQTMLQLTKDTWALVFIWALDNANGCIYKRELAFLNVRWALFLKGKETHILYGIYWIFFKKKKKKKEASTMNQ